jgi:hypothetical protein
VTGVQTCALPICDNYQHGYRAVLSAPSDIPAADTKHNPVLIATYQGDPLLIHIDRLPALPAGWSTGSADNPVALEDLFGDFLKKHPGPSYESFNADTDRGFVSVETAHFNGVIQWSGDLTASKLTLHNVGESSELIKAEQALVIDLPGHGLSGDISDAATLADWADVIKSAITNLGAINITCVEGDQFSALLALAVAKSVGADCVCATSAHIPIDGKTWQSAQPDLTPDRFGSHLNKAWQVVRSTQFFWPWFEAKNSNAIDFDKNQIDPEYLALAHRALLRARSREKLTALLLSVDKAKLVADAPKISSWHIADWATKRDDVWRP